MIQGIIVTEKGEQTLLLNALLDGIARHVLIQINLPIQRPPVQ